MNWYRTYMLLMLSELTNNPWVIGTCALAMCYVGYRMFRGREARFDLRESR